MGGIQGGCGLHGGGEGGGRQNHCLGQAAITKKIQKEKNKQHHRKAEPESGG